LVAASLADIWVKIGETRNPYPNWTGFIEDMAAHKGFRKAKFLFRKMIWRLINAKDEDENG